MVKHIILWALKEMSDSEKESVKAGITNHPFDGWFVIFSY